MDSQVLHTTILYQQIMAMPENMVGEIINGRLVTMTRPAGPHCQAGSVLGANILFPYQNGRGGPGGWWIVDEPEIHFIRNVEVVVPDIAGWKRERMSRLPRTHRFEIVPNWVCEILSPSTAKIDRAEKMPLYARYGVSHLWLVDPLIKTLEVYELQNGRWSNLNTFKDDDVVSALPFQEIVIQLVDLWITDDAE